MEYISLTFRANVLSRRVIHLFAIRRSVHYTLIYFTSVNANYISIVLNINVLICLQLPEHLHEGELVRAINVRLVPFFVDEKKAEDSVRIFASGFPAPFAAG